MVMEDLPEHPDVVGLVEIAAMLGILRNTLDQWKHRGKFDVAPRWRIGGNLAWDRAEVKAWAEARKD